MVYNSLVRECFFLGFVLLNSSRGIAQIPMVDINGKVVPFFDRPLVIGSYANVSETLSFKPMSAPENAIGYLNIFAIDPYLVSAGLKPAFSSEHEALMQSKKYLHLLAEGGETLSFNGRVIVDFHGGPDGSIASDFLENGVFKTAFKWSSKSFAKRLGGFFKRLGIKVNRLDLYACCGNKIDKGFNEGLQEAGINDIEVNTFATDETIYPDKPGSGNADIVIENGLPKTERIPIDDYFLRAKFPEKMPPNKTILGDPGPVTTPEVIVKTCE